METAKILFQIATTIFVVLAIMQKQKWKMMLYYTISNIFFVAMFFVFQRTATAMICVVATVRTFIYMIYSLKKLKPNVVWLCVFEVGFVVSTILTWQDALDLLPLFAVMASGYGSWQENPSVLRTTYIFNNLCYVVYEAIIGSYIAMAVEAINFVCGITCFVYYCILKKETPILEKIFGKKKKRIGAFVGKFYPPHIGHLSVVDNAIKDFDEVYVIISKNDIRNNQIKDEQKFAVLNAELIKSWFEKHYQNEPKVKVAIFDESEFRPYPEDVDKWSEKFKREFPFVNTKIADAGYREFNQKYFPDYDFYEIDREKIPVHATMLRNDMQANIDYLIPEAREYFEQKK